MQQTFLGGWPLQWDDQNEIVGFGLPPLPLLCQFKMRTEVCPQRETFLANIGSSDALPELVQQLYRAFVNKASALDEYPSIGPFLTQTERFSPKLWHQRFFSPESNLIKGLIADGRMTSSKIALIKDIQERRSNGMTVSAAARIWLDYVEGMHSTVRSMLSNGVFHSETLKHAGDVLAMVDWSKACADDEFSLRATLARLGAKNPNARKHDRLLVTHKAFMCMWEELNKYLHMNSANTTYALELLISTLMLKFGDNATWYDALVSCAVLSSLP